MPKLLAAAALRLAVVVAELSVCGSAEKEKARKESFWAGVWWQRMSVKQT